MINNNTIKSFTDLIAWQKGHKLVLLIYQIIKLFPSNERFGLTSQMSRAVVSVTSNIAEGFSRQSDKEKIQFYHNALGSLTELQNQLLIAKDIKYLDKELFDKAAKQSIEIHKLINGLIKSRKNKLLDT